MTTDSPLPSPGRAKAVPILLWTGQALLAALFLFAGAAKLTMPAEALAKAGLPVPFLKFIAVAELCGAFGLVLPGLLRIRRGLTPVAAACLAIIMIGATVTTLAIGGGALAAIPFVVGALATFVVYRHRRAAVTTALACNP